MKLTRRAALATTLLPFAGPSAARAQWAPSHPLRWIVGYPAGGGTDVLARLLGSAMGPKLGQPVVVENRPGAATNIGAEAAARAEPDGHTVFTAGNETLVFNPALYRVAALRRGPRPSPARADGALPPGGGGAHRLRRHHAAGAAGPRQGGARHGRLRQPRHRQPAPPGDGTAGAGRRREAEPRALSRHGAGAERPDGRHGGGRGGGPGRGRGGAALGRIRPLALCSAAPRRRCPACRWWPRPPGCRASRPMPGRASPPPPAPRTPPPRGWPRRWRRPWRKRRCARGCRRSGWSR